MKIVLLILLAAGAVFADEPLRTPTPEKILLDAQARFTEADYGAAADLAALVPRDAPASARAEAARLRGLSLFFLGDRGQAELALLDYLRLVPDAHLDPALVAPDAIVFFEEVRTRHAGELITLKPRPQKNRYWVLNLLPPFGQFQNGTPVRGWIFAGAEVAFLATNIVTFVMLKSSCSGDLTCTQDPSTSRTLQTINIGSGLAFAITYAVGVIDGIAGYTRAKDRDRWQLGVDAAPTQPTYVYLRHSLW